jgi:hypothetical protein
MTDQKHQIDTARASPTKAFFVRMLTRDIELQDAILDLLDNCLDGILRSGGAAADPMRPYAAFRATLTMATDHFIIEDNCGGIPLETAKKYAFAMGRPDGAGDLTPATIGMYGIGMKRAIFKLGTDALVESRSDQGFNVEFTNAWMSSDDWDDLPIYELNDDQLDGHGTRITVMELSDEARAALSDTNWIDDFRSLVSRHYSLIIAKGFEVVVGTPEEIEGGIAPIAAEPFRLLSAQSEEGAPAIAPYVYTGTIDGVDVEIYAGLYRELLSQDEIDAEEETRGTSDDAGWTVACNDRVVIWKDKTRLTGWGEATVPNYHGQFIAITGIVLLRSNDPRKLPLTTTKRGIDAASNVYLTAKDLMREATKALTSFTNKWKKFPEARESLYKSSEYVALSELRTRSQTLPFKDIRKVETVKKFEPNYPVPPQQATSARVSFVAEKEEIARAALYLFDTVDVKSDQVGRAAFDRVLAEIPEAAE